MLTERLTLLCILIFNCYVWATAPNDIGKLPYCVDNSDTGLVLVSTLDGKLSALNNSGFLSWNIDTGPGSLLKSNIHNVELTNNGEWIRIIPSLSGSLYKFNGKTVDAIPVTADNLLKSSFFYSNDLVIAGGKEVRTYGIGLTTGNVLYECSVLGCQNKTYSDEEIDNVLIIERNTLTVRAHEPRNGNERWNFSVGHHNLKLPSQGCINNHVPTNFNISAVLPDGIIQAIRNSINAEILWEHKFDTPIVSIWKWNGRDLTEVDVFDNIKPYDKVNVQMTPAIYLGMHNKQLYIHESNKMLNVLQINNYPSGGVIESRSITRIPWKPIPAVDTDVITKDDDKSTALSVLYNSEYVNGNGYYLYSEHDLARKNTLICDQNNTDNGSIIIDNDQYVVMDIWFWWKEILVLSFAAALALNLLCNFRVFGFSRFENSSSDKSGDTEELSVNKISDGTSDLPFHSRYLGDFETVCCLGKGGFGIVFEAKQKIDECKYAIKRITLPNDNRSKERVLREVKALATLDHQNIVRYFNSWVECPPVGWELEHDKDWTSGMSANTYPYSVESVSKVETKSHRRNNSTIIEMSDIVSFRNESESTSQTNSNSEMSDIVSFRNKSESTSQTNSNSGDYAALTHSIIDNLDCCYGEVDQREPLHPAYLYIQMQLCKKESLKDWLLVNTDRYVNDIVPIFKQIVNAVEYVHQKNLIHRDLKPSNIFFSIEGNIKVGDFGLVTTMHDSLDDHTSSYNTAFQSHTRGAGTQLYMSPEQIQGKKYNCKVDIYSLGVILFELLVPFTTEMERYKTLTDLRNNIYPRDFPNNFPQEYELLKLMLSQNPDDRPTTFGIRAKPPLSDVSNGDAFIN